MKWDLSDFYAEDWFDVLRQMDIAIAVTYASGDFIF